MIPPADARCGNCLFFKNKGEAGLKILYGCLDHELEGTGICHALPPALIQLPKGRLISRHALTGEEAFACKEWVPESRKSE